MTREAAHGIMTREAGMMTRIRDEYPKPWRVERRVSAWFVVDADGRIVAGGFDSAHAAWTWMDRW